LAFFSKTNVMINILHNLAMIWVKKRQFFRRIFRRKNVKNHNIGPKSLIIMIKTSRFGSSNWKTYKKYIFLHEKNTEVVGSNPFSVNWKANFFSL
jgi:hypothetical protein